MRRIRLVALVLTVLFYACGSIEPIESTHREDLAFESLSFPGALWNPFMPSPTEGTALTVTGTLAIPPTSEPVPAVVITHGCSGVTSNESSWARELEKRGYASFIVRSFSARDIQEICTGEQTVNLASMLVDAYRARDVLADHPYIDDSRISLLGFSFGGRTALWTAMERFQEQYGGTGFAAHLAFYPSTCYIELEGETSVSSGPIRIFHGTADDWTPIAQCRTYVQRLQEAGVDAAIFEYEGAHHSFDAASLPAEMSIDAVSPRHCSFVERDGAIIDPATGDVASVQSPCVERGVTIGHDAAARAQAIEDVMAVLAGSDRG